MKKMVFLLMVAGSSVSFSTPVKQAAPEEIKKESLVMLMFKCQMAH